MAEVRPLKTSQYLDELRFRLRSQQLFLEHIEVRFERLLAQLTGLPAALLHNERALKAALYESHHLRQQVQHFEQIEADYLILLKGTQEELEQAQANQQLYEQELEQLIQHHEQQGVQRASESQQQSSQAQDMGRSLARLVSERNALEQQYEALAARHAALESQAAAQTDQLQAQEKLLQAQPLSEPFLRRLHYTLACETALALGQPLKAAQKHRLASELGLSAYQQRQLEGRVYQGPIYQALAVPPDRGASAPVEAVPAAEPQPLPWAKIPAGQYGLGDAMHPAERPEHRVDLATFSLARYAVTNAEFAEFMADGGYDNPDYWWEEGWALRTTRHWTHPAFWGEKTYRSGLDFADDPVVGVSWYEAEAYARWSGTRLPTEAEWEAAARGVEGRIWPWGNQWQADAANTAEAGHLTTTPVGLFPAGATPEGVLDLIGNVFEWTASLYQPYPYVAAYHEQPHSTLDRSVRGCSFNHKGSYFSRAAYRFHCMPSTRQSDMGFRVIATKSP